VCGEGFAENSRQELKNSPDGSVREGEQNAQIATGRNRNDQPDWGGCGADPAGTD
jgi:hypothetical protein